MARTKSFSPATKVIPASATTVVVWTPSEIDSAGVVLLTMAVAATAGAFTIGNCTAVAVKANGVTVLNCTLTQLLAYQERWSPKGASDAATGRVLNIPLNKLGAAGGDDEEDLCQFMPGATITVEATFVTGAGVSGTAMLGWTKTTIEPRYYLTLLRQPMNVAANQTNARVPIGAQGLVEGIGIVTAALGQVRAIVSGFEVMNQPGVLYNGAANQGDMLQASEALWDAPDDASQITTFMFSKFGQGLQANPATSWLEVTTGAGFNVADECVIFSVVPIVQG